MVGESKDSQNSENNSVHYMGGGMPEMTTTSQRASQKQRPTSKQISKSASLARLDLEQKQ